MGKKGKKKNQEQQSSGQPATGAGPSTAPQQQGQQQPPQQQRPQHQGGQQPGPQQQQQAGQQPHPGQQQQPGQQQRQKQPQGGQPRQPQQGQGPRGPPGFQQQQQPSFPPQQGPGPRGPTGFQQQQPSFPPQQGPGPRGPTGFQQQQPSFPPQQQGFPPGFQQQRPRGQAPGGFLQHRQFSPPPSQVSAPPPQWGPPGIQQQRAASPQHQQVRGPPQQQWRDPQKQQQRPQQVTSPGFTPQQLPPVQPTSPPPVQQQGGGGRGRPQQQQRGFRGRGRPQQEEVTSPGFPQPSQPTSSPPAEQQQQRGPPQQQQRVPPQQQQRGPPQQQQHSQQQQQPQPPTSSSPPSPKGESDCLALAVSVKPGTKGRKISVEANHLALRMGSLMEAIHYDVTITPDTPKGLMRAVMIEFGRRYYPDRHPAFDGRKNLYSPKRLPFGGGDQFSGTVKVAGENGDREFQVEIKFARTVDLSPLHDLLKTKESPQDALQCLDIVLRNAPSLNCIQAGRSFFTPPRDQIISLGEGMEMYYGFYQSAIRGWKPLLNVDVSHKAFPKALYMLDLICELGSDYRNTMTRDQLDRPLSDWIARSLEKFVRMLKVKYEIPGQSASKRIQRINGLDLPASKATFKLDNGQTTTVEKYFSEIKRVRLHYPHLPTLWVGARQRESKLLLPMEFCSLLPGQVTNRKMTENQTSAMIKKAATSTQVRKQKIVSSISGVRYNEDPCMKEFGFSVNDQFERLDARVLPPPSLEYANKMEVTPKAGVWMPGNNRFLVGAKINKWTVLSATRQPARGMEKLVDMVSQTARKNGIQMEPAIPPFQHIGGRQQIADFVSYFETKRDYDLIFVVVPNSGPQYSYVKKAAEINVGCLTQCLKDKTLFKLNPQTVVNILLKVNSKMNGTNHAFAFNSRPRILARPCMIMGADVTHPSPDAKDVPSVAAVTASHDPKGFQYNICWRLQPPKVEVIEDLQNITIEQLKFFYTKTGCKPETIVFFRDGVSEGQFREVRRAEIWAIQQACKKLQADDYEPKITFLVVQKRHHTRLFPTNPRDSEDKNCNVPAGTCVDTVITNPRMQDFYLVSHASIQGVAKPTKYCTLWDDNKMSNDEIEELAYHLCHLFSRCNRSVSYPAPTYYAHLAAARAKVYIENDKLNMDRLQSYYDKYRIQQCISRGKPMFFV